MKTSHALSLGILLMLLAVLVARSDSGMAGEPSRSNAAQPVPRPAIEKKDIEAIEWLLGGMIHCLGTSDPSRASEIRADWRRQVADLRHAYETQNPALPQMVKRFMHDTAEPRMRDMRGGRPVYLLLGFHGAQLFEGDEYGYFEFDSPHMAADRIVQILDLSDRCGVPVNLEFGLSSLRILCRRYPELKQALTRATRAGRAEIINSAYALPYGHLIRPESNLRQFEYGGQVYEELVGGRPNVYVFSEFSAFPQMPQVVKFFGIPNVGLRGRMGFGPSTPYPLIVWEGLDGTRVRALTQQTNTYSGEYYGMRFYQEIFALLVQAASGNPRDYALYASLEDHPLVFASDNTEEAMRVSRFADVLGHHCTYSALFEKGPAPSGIFRFPYDQSGLSGYKSKSGNWL